MDGWKIDKLKDLCEFQRGLTYSKKDEVDTSNNIVLRANNINLETNKLDFTELKYINDKITASEKKKLKKGSILICTASGSKSHLGKVALIDNDYDYAFGGFMGMINPNNSKILSKYLFYVMISKQYKDFIHALGDGMNINNLKFDDLGIFEVSYPESLDEQKRIVAILDEAFAAIDIARANAERNCDNARALFESYLNNIFANPGEDWQEKELGEVSLRVSVGYVGPTSKYYCGKSEGIPLIRSQNVRPRQLTFDGIRYVTKEFHQQTKKSQLQAGDILFVRVGANRGDCCLVPNGLGEINCANIVFARPHGILPEFIEIYCQSDIGKKRLLGMTTGSAQGVINTESVARLTIPIPSLNAQSTLVKALNTLFTEAQSLESHYQQKAQMLISLKQSLLQQAFTGQLTQNAEKELELAGV